MRERKNGVIEWTMRHYQITLLVITVLVGLGILGLVDMPKQEFPEFTIRQGVVVGVYPGATSGEVEEQLAKPLERYLFTFKEVKKKKTYSMSRDGMVYMMVELNDDVNNKDEVWSKIKLGLQNFKSQLPSGVLAVIANDDFGDTSALLITLESEDKTYRELQRYMETLEDRLRRIESVSNLRRYGVQNEQISVYLDPDKLAAYGLDTRMLMTTLFTQGFTTASGSLENGGLDIPIHLSVTYPSEREVGEQILLADADGHMIRLKDVARIVREYPEPDSYITNNGKKAIILSMEMREGHNIVRYGKEVDEVLHAFERDLPESVSIRRIADQPKVVGDSVSSFVRDLFVSIVVVILVMMVLFPFRSALVAATSIPISVFISIGVMYACGIPLNTVTLAALIVVLGMIVDNSIIVIDAYLEYLDKGYSRWYAAVYSAKNYLVGYAVYLRDLFPVAFHDDGADVGFRDLLPLDAFHLPHGVAGGGDGLYPAAGAGLDQEGIEVRAGEYGQEEVQSAGYRTGRLYEGTDVDFPFPENHDRSGRLDGCLGDPDDHPTEPAYDADSRPGSVRRRDLSPAGNLAGPYRRRER